MHYDVLNGGGGGGGMGALLYKKDRDTPVIL